MSSNYRDTVSSSRADSGRLDLATAWVVAVGSVLGLVASFQLTLEKLRVLADPDYVPACDINPVLSCGSVITTAQAEVFGFPNPLLGLTGFAITAALGLLLIFQVRLPRWVWLGLNAGTLTGVTFVCWLVWQSLYSIGSLCPWCIVVWVVVIPMFVWVTSANILSGRMPSPPALKPYLTAVASLRYLLLLAWYATIAALIFVRWQEFWLGGIR